MRVHVKPGVRFGVVSPAGFRILEALKQTAADLALDLTITSGTDGVHAGPTDPHYLGSAYDVRSHGFTPAIQTLVLTTLLGHLGHDYFSGFLEHPGTAVEHFHIQRRVGTQFTVEEYLHV